MATQGGTTVTFTDEQLWTAVRSVGSDGQSFTCATVREFLGVSTKKRQELAQFRDRFRAFRLTAGGEIVKAGKSAYRLKPAAAAEEAQEHAPAVVEAALPEVAEAAAVEAGPAVERESAPVAAAPEATPLEAASEAAPVEAAAAEAVPVEAPAPAPAPLPSFSSPLAIEETDMGFGEPMDVVAAESGELAANHVIFSAWPESMQPPATTTEAAVEAASADDDAVTQEVAIPQPSEAEIEAEVREIVAAPEVPAQPTSDSLFSSAEQAVARTWRDRGQWLGRRFAEFFGRSH
jgi:hypothetical protein